MTDILVACERLALSREHLRRVLDNNRHNPQRAPSPLHLAASVARDQLHEAVQPIAERHPLSLVAGAAVAGAMLVLGRPWRWLLTPAILGSVMPHLVSGAVNRAPALPWMKLLAEFTRPSPKTAGRQLH